MASDVARKLAFAGIAVVWIFSGGGVGNASTVRIEEGFAVAAFLLVAALVCDFLQYVYLTIAWKRFVSEKELEVQAGRSAKDFLAPADMDVPAQRFWKAKMLLVALGSGVLLFEVARSVLF